MGLLAILRRKALHLPTNENPEEIKKKLILTRPLLAELRGSLDQFAQFTQYYPRLKRAAELIIQNGRIVDLIFELGEPPTQQYYNQVLRLLERLELLLHDLSLLDPETKMHRELFNLESKIKETLEAIEWYNKNYKKILALNITLSEARNEEYKGRSFAEKQQIQKIKKAYKRLTSNEPRIVVDIPINSINNVIVWISVLGERYDIVLYARDKKVDINLPEVFVHWTGERSWGVSEIKNFIRTGIIPQHKDYTAFNISYFPGFVSFYAWAGNHLKNGVGFLLNPGWVKKHASEFRCNDFCSREVRQLCERWGIRVMEIYYYSNYHKKHHALHDEVQHYGSVPYEAIVGIICPNYHTQKVVIFFMCKLAQNDPSKVIPIYNKRGDMIWP